MHRAPTVAAPLLLLLVLLIIAPPFASAIDQKWLKLTRVMAERQANITLPSPSPLGRQKQFEPMMSE